MASQFQTFSLNPTQDRPPVEVPSPLPHHRGALSIPESLKSSIITALSSSPSAITHIRNAMHHALTSTSPSSGTGTSSSNESSNESFNAQLEQWFEEEFERMSVEMGNEKTDEELLRGLMRLVRESVQDYGGRDGWRARGSEWGKEQLSVRGEMVEDMVKAVRGELEECCVVVDGDGWVG